MKARAAFLSALLAASPLAAAPLVRDLGLGLSYCRVHELPEDLPLPAAPRHAQVLDVRYVRGNRGAGAALLAWLKASASPRSPVFLLANASTSGDVLAPLNAPDSVAGLVILGAGTADFQPDISVRTTAAAERRAYEALERGAPIDSLIREERDKPRDDEARLEREHRGEADDDEAKPAEAPSGASGPIDAGLQRAVQLHRALLALKRL